MRYIDDSNSPHPAQWVARFGSQDNKLKQLNLSNAYFNQYGLGVNPQFCTSQTAIVGELERRRGDYVILLGIFTGKCVGLFITIINLCNNLPCMNITDLLF